MNELKPWIGEPPHVTPPNLPGYRQVSHEKLDLGSLSVVGTLLIPVWAVVMFGLVAALGGRSSYDVNFSLVTAVIAVCALIVVVFVHELVHGGMAALLRAKPSFGIGPGFAYTTFLDPMSKTQYLLVGLAPLVFITVVCISAAIISPGIAGWMVFTAAVNASGAIGDLWMTVRILRSPARARFHDLADGFAVYAPDPAG